MGIADRNAIEVDSDSNDSCFGDCIAFGCEAVVAEVWKRVVQR